MLKLILLMPKLIAEPLNLQGEFFDLCKSAADLGGTLRGDGRKVALVTKLFLEPNHGFFGLRELGVFDPICDGKTQSAVNEPYLLRGFAVACAVKELG